MSEQYTCACGVVYQSWDPHRCANTTSRSTGVTHPEPEKSADLTPEMREARKALRCLYLATTEDVARDVNAKVEAAFAALERENTDLRADLSRTLACLSQTQQERDEAQEANAAMRREIAESMESISRLHAAQCDEIAALKESARAAIDGGEVLIQTLQQERDTLREENAVLKRWRDDIPKMETLREQNAVLAHALENCRSVRDDYLRTIRDMDKAKAEAPIVIESIIREENQRLTARVAALEEALLALHPEDCGTPTCKARVVLGQAPEAPQK